MSKSCTSSRTHVLTSVCCSSKDDGAWGSGGVEAQGLDNSE
jgi:hypothetical protein